MFKAALVVLAILLLALFAGSAYVVHETDQVIITQFGNPVAGPIDQAGLRFRVPFIQDVRRFEKRILDWDGDANEIVTKDKKTIFVDTTARWRIKDPLLFLKSVHDESRAQSRLDDVLDGATRELISKHNLIEAVRATNRPFLAEESSDIDFGDGRTDEDRITVGREQLIENILMSARENVRELGIELVDFRIRRIDYSEKVRRSVYERMIAERNQIADRYRSEGRGREAEIAGMKEKELRRIESEAIRSAEVIRGEADAEATRIYAEAYGADPEFYAFFQSLETLKKALVAGDTTLVLTTQSELLKYLKDPTAPPVN